MNFLKLDNFLKKWFFIFSAITAIYIFLIPFVIKSSWISSSDFHSCIEITGSFIAISAGFACLGFYFATENRFYLIISLGFFISGSEDFIHGILSWKRLLPDSNLDFSRFIPITYASGRIILALLIILAPYLENLFKKTKNTAREVFIFSVCAYAFGAVFTALASIINLPPFIFPENTISRPVDFFSAILFLIAFLSILKRLFKFKDSFSAILCTSILFNLYGQLYMSFSKEIFNIYFDIAHFSNVFSYIMPVIAVVMQSNNAVNEAKIQITERKKTENKLKNSLIERDSILQDIGEGVLVVDNNNSLVIINNTALKLLEIEEKLNTGVDLKSILLNSCIEEREFRNFFINLEYKKFNLKINTIPKRVVDIIFTTYKNEENNTAGKIFVLRDITIEREIDRMKTDFVSSVSHELRTPLSSILGFSSTILRDKDMDEETKSEFLQIINDESKRLSRLIEDVLSISRIESGKVSYKFERLYLKDTIKEAYITYKQKAEKKGVNFSLETFYDIPLIWADKDAIMQVAVNLIGNAVKFSKKGKDIKICVNSNEEFVELIVKDSGLGIPKKDQKKIFEKFYRVYRPGTQIQGTGLGLSIVKEIVTAHKGEILLESEEGVGTKFIVRFPILKE